MRNNNCTYNTDNFADKTNAGKRIVLQHAVIIITPILPEESYLDTAAKADIDAAQQFGNSHRRASFLAWRTAVRKEVGKCSISYDENGAPIITDKQLKIGVSHSSKTAAIIVSSMVCAIDIEQKDRNYSKVAARYITPEESNLPDSKSPDFQAIIWCAKETLYKISGRQELDLLEDINVKALDFDSLTAIGGIRSKDGRWDYINLHIISDENIICLYAVARDNVK